MIPYFSIIDNPGEIIVLILVMLFCACLSYMGCHLAYLSRIKWYHTVIWTISGPIYFILLLWIFIGDSTSWSEPIGLWLRGK